MKNPNPVPPPRLLAKVSVQAMRNEYAQRLLQTQHEAENTRVKLRDLDQTVEQLRGALQGMDALLRIPDLILSAPEPTPDSPAPTQPEETTA